MKIELSQKVCTFKNIYVSKLILIWYNKLRIFLTYKKCHNESFLKELVNILKPSNIMAAYHATGQGIDKVV